ncbi:MAG: RNA polymerase sigma factor region1.1 domain-containing protein, partial [Verrucomicrobiota bacterium]|nr:RNA polymerase sigma factor region1.1 domain-containing protein [Verrucomicrobiota bacterium]
MTRKAAKTAPKKAAKKAHKKAPKKAAKKAPKKDSQKKQKALPAEEKAASKKKPKGKSRIDTPEIQEKMRELIKLAKEQDYLTYDDIHEILPKDLVDPADVAAILDRLRNM